VALIDRTKSGERAAVERAGPSIVVTSPMPQADVHDHGCATPDQDLSMTGPGAETTAQPDSQAMLTVALMQARLGLTEGGVPIGAALFGADGILLGQGHNRRVQDGDPSMHAETAAFKAAGRQRSYRGTTMVTTLSPCWYCSGLVRQFGISRVLIGEARTFQGGHDWLAELGVSVTVLDDDECVQLLGGYIEANPQIWAEDIGVD
jgi:creatinine deaminase